MGNLLVWVEITVKKWLIFILIKKKQHLLKTCQFLQIIQLDFLYYFNNNYTKKILIKNVNKKMEEFRDDKK